jgi:hypothetical protein
VRMLRRKLVVVKVLQHLLAETKNLLTS